MKTKGRKAYLTLRSALMARLLLHTNALGLDGEELRDFVSLIAEIYILPTHSWYIELVSDAVALVKAERECRR